MAHGRQFYYKKQKENEISNMLKKWLPFIVLICAVIIAFINLVFFPNDQYIPQTDDPDQIYYEACSDCHGENGQGKGLLYPAFDTLAISKIQIKKNIVDGGWLMPKFKHIHGDTLEKLIEYIYEKKYKLNR